MRSGKKAVKEKKKKGRRLKKKFSNFRETSQPCQVVSNEKHRPWRSVVG